MKMPSLFVAAAGATLLGASPPPMGPMDGQGGPGGYPPCTSRGQDRCIQLYERGVANPRNLAMNGRPDRAPPVGDMRGRRVVVVAGNDYPPCGHGIDDRCIQAPAAAPGGAGYGSAPRRVALRAHYDRHLVRIDERG